MQDVARSARTVSSYVPLVSMAAFFDDDTHGKFACALHEKHAVWSSNAEPTKCSNIKMLRRLQDKGGQIVHRTIKVKLR